MSSSNDNDYSSDSGDEENHNELENDDDENNNKEEEEEEEEIKVQPQELPHEEIQIYAVTTAKKTPFNTKAKKGPTNEKNDKGKKKMEQNNLENRINKIEEDDKKQKQKTNQSKSKSTPSVRPSSENPNSPKTPTRKGKRTRRETVHIFIQSKEPNSQYNDMNSEDEWKINKNANVNRIPSVAWEKDKKDIPQQGPNDPWIPDSDIMKALRLSDPTSRKFSGAPLTIKLRRPFVGNRSNRCNKFNGWCKRLESYKARAFEKADQMNNVEYCSLNPPWKSTEDPNYESLISCNELNCCCIPKIPELKNCHCPVCRATAAYNYVNKIRLNLMLQEACANAKKAMSMPRDFTYTNRRTFSFRTPNRMGIPMDTVVTKTRSEPQNVPTVFSPKYYDGFIAPKNVLKAKKLCVNQQDNNQKGPQKPVNLPNGFATGFNSQADKSTEEVCTCGKKCGGKNCKKCLKSGNLNIP